MGEMMSRVLVHDISHWQGDLTNYWQLFKDKGCAAIIVKATEGLAFYSSFKTYIEQARAHGFLVGSYHYYRQQIKNASGDWVACDPKRQAENYYNWVSSMGELDLPPALDVEKVNNPFLSQSSIEICLYEIENRFGRIPFVYSNPDVLTNILKTPPWGRYPLWLAHYISEPSVMIPKSWNKWTLWQFSDKITYTPPGSTVKKPIDHNWFNGDLMDLYAFCGVGEVDPPEEPPIVTPPVDHYVRVIARQWDGKPGWLFFRNRPEFYAGDGLAVGYGVELKLLDPQPVNGLWHVTLDDFEGYVSAGKAYTKEV